MSHNIGCHLCQKLSMYMPSAYDIVMEVTSRHAEQDYAALQQDLDLLGVWRLVNHLSFNHMLSQKKAKTTPPPQKLLGTEIERVDSIKSLGLTIKTTSQQNLFYLHLYKKKTVH